MQSKGHAIRATLVLQSNAFTMMPKLKPCNCEPGIQWLEFSQHTSKNGHIKTIILMCLQATHRFNMNGTRTLNHCEAWFQAKKAHQKMIEYHFNG